MKKNRVLIIDALNQYLRGYIVNPTLALDGQPAGGVIGFMKTLQKLLREIKPDQVYVCWDGQQGKNRRRNMSKDYKEGRKPIKFNHRATVMTEQQELQNKIWQQNRLVEYLNQMPVAQLLYDTAEADDVIAVLCFLLEGSEKIIVSSDKDFYQLLDDETIILRPTQDQVISRKTLVEDQNIHPHNYALVKAVCGDKSDNIKGIRGAGEKTVAKRFPFLCEEKSHTISDLVKHAKESESKIKLYDAVIENESMIHKNYQLVQLYMPSLQINVRKSIREVAEDYPYELNKLEIDKMMVVDGFAALNSWIDLFAHLRRIKENKI